MKLFLDDTRKFPFGFDFCVRHFDQCILLLDLFCFDYVSLAYSLWRDEPTGYEVLVWMVAHQKFPKRLNIHSNNISGCKKMEQYLAAHCPQSCTVSFRTLPK